MCDCKELLTPCNDLHVDDRNSTYHEGGYDMAVEVDIIGKTCAIGDMRLCMLMSILMWSYE